jgi:hypothetical protein
MRGAALRDDRRRTGPEIRQVCYSHYRDAKGSSMRNLSRRLDGLETTLAPESKPFLIWAMIDGRRMTDAEINEAFQEAIATGRAGPGDKPLAISWMGDQGVR